MAGLTSRGGPIPGRRSVALFGLVVLRIRVVRTMLASGCRSLRFGCSAAAGDRVSALGFCDLLHCSAIDQEAVDQLQLLLVEQLAQQRAQAPRGCTSADAA